MKSFKAYLTESVKTYEFRVRIACEMMSADMMTKIKQVLETYKVDKISSPKRLPIHESPLFPNMGPVEVNVFDVSVCYPANDDQIRNLIAECGCAPAACIRVTPANSPFEAALDGKEVSNIDGGVVLEQPDMKAAPVDDDLVGQKRIPNLIKELEETRKYEYPEAAGGVTPVNKTTNELPIGNASPIGTHKNKVPDARKIKAGNGK
jgi:hypothetical protein